MRFYLAVIISFGLMLFALSQCAAQVMVPAGFFQLQSKGGEAQGKQLKHHRMSHRHHVVLALSVAVPRPRPNLELLHPEHYPRLTAAQGRALADEVFRTPQQRISDTFKQLEEAYANH